MNPRALILRILPPLTVILGVGAPTLATAQADGSPIARSPSNWSVIDAVGYAGLGFATGLLTTWDMEGTGFGPPESALIVLGVTTVAGTVVGA